MVKTKTTNNLGSWLQAARLACERVGTAAILEVQVLAAHTLQTSRAWVLAHPEYSLTQPQQKTLDALLDRLIAGTPLPFKALVNTTRAYLSMGAS